MRSSFLLLLSAIASAVPSALAVRVISMGSSYAAGPSIEPVVDAAARRSGNNYANVFARKLSLNTNDTSQFLDLSVSGATLLNLISTPQNVLGKEFPPQVSQLPNLTAGDDGSDVVVTISAGGNDKNYIGSMLTYSYTQTEYGRDYADIFLPAAAKQMFNITPVVASDQQVLERFATLLDKIHGKYPNGTVYLVEYFSLMGPDTVAGKDVPWDEGQIQSYKQQAKKLSQLYAKAAQGRDGVYVLPLAEQSRLHALGSSDPWVSADSPRDLLSGGAWHPNKEGFRNAGEYLFEFHTKLNAIRS